MVWGPIGDRIGRVRALMLTILFYSLFTFMCGLVTNIWQLAVLRVLCGIGIGGEQPVGATYIAEELDERTRKIGAGLMHTGYYFGFFFAAVANYFIGANYGWRWMFIFGGLPALMIAFIRYGVHESEKWQEKFGEASRQRPTMAQAFGALFTPQVQARHLRDVGLVPRVDHHAVGGIDLRASGGNADWRRAAGNTAADAARIASYPVIVLAIGTIIGCVLVPFVAESLGRRLSMAHLSDDHGRQRRDRVRLRVLQPRQSAAAILRLRLLHGAWRRELRQLHDLAAGAVHDRLPRQRDRVHQLGRPIRRRRDDVRSSRRASGRTAASGVPVAVVAMAFVFGLILLPLAKETKGHVLPA